MSLRIGVKDNWDNWIEGDKPIPHQERVKQYLKAVHFSRDAGIAPEAPISVKEFVHIVQRHKISLQAGWKKSKAAFKRALEILLKDAGIPKNSEIRAATKKPGPLVEPEVIMPIQVEPEVTVTKKVETKDALDKPIPHQERVKWYLKAFHFSRDAAIAPETPISVKEFVDLVRRYKIAMPLGWRKSKATFKRALETLLNDAGVPKNSEIRAAKHRLPVELVGLISSYSAEANEYASGFENSVEDYKGPLLFRNEEERRQYPKGARLLKEVEAERNETMVDELLKFFSPGQNKKAALDEMQKSVKKRHEFFDLKERCRKVNEGVEKAIRQTGQNAAFIFPEELRELARDVPYLGLSWTRPAVTTQALQEIFKYMPHLQSLDIRGATFSEEMVDAILQFKNLVSLNLGTTKMNDAHLKKLAQHTQLKNLNISWNEGITDLQPLSACTALECLALYHCTNVTSVQPLSSCRELEVLDIFSCDNITDLKPLLACPKLRRVTGGGHWPPAS